MANEDFNPDRLIEHPRTLGEVHAKEREGALITECCRRAIGPDCRFCPKCGHEARVESAVAAPVAPPLVGRDIDWDIYESEQTERQFKSYCALGVNLTTLQTAAAEVAHWNRQYRELAWESAREAVTALRSTPRDAAPQLTREQQRMEVLCPKCHKHFPKQFTLTTIGLWTIGWTCPDCQTVFNIGVKYDELRVAGKG